MSTISASPVAVRRPATVSAAVGLLVLIVVLTVPIALVAMDGIDPVFVTIAAVFATLKLVAAAGLWRCLKWAARLGFVVTLLDTLLAIPGLFDGTNAGGSLWLWAAGIVLGSATLVLIALPSSRRAYV